MEYDGTFDGARHGPAGTDTIGWDEPAALMSTLTWNWGAAGSGALSADFLYLFTGVTPGGTEDEFLRDVITNVGMSGSWIGTDGMGLVLQLKGSALATLSSRWVAAAQVDAIHAGRHEALWIVTGQRAEGISSSGKLCWQSTDNGYTSPAGIAFDAGNDDEARLWVTSVRRADAFRIGEGTEDRCIGSGADIGSPATFFRQN